MNMSAWSRWETRIARAAGLLLIAGLLMIAWGPPRGLADWLSGNKLQPDPAARYIVILDGGGMPSGATLLRTWHAARFGQNLTNSVFIIALPSLNPTPDSGVMLMRNELLMRGIPAERIRLEYRGLNTHQQASNIRDLLGNEALEESLVVVTSGYHVRRAVLCFRHEGFTRATTLTATSSDEDIWPGPLAWLRYGIWNNARHLTEMCRELIALAAYKLQGWI